MQRGGGSGRGHGGGPARRRWLLLPRGDQNLGRIKTSSSPDPDVHLQTQNTPTCLRRRHKYGPKTQTKICAKTHMPTCQHRLRKSIEEHLVDEILALLLLHWRGLDWARRRRLGRHQPVPRQLLVAEVHRALGPRGLGRRRLRHRGHLLLLREHVLLPHLLHLLLLLALLLLLPHLLVLKLELLLLLLLRAELRRRLDLLV